MLTHNIRAWLVLEYYYNFTKCSTTKFRASFLSISLAMSPSPSNCAKHRGWKRTPMPKHEQTSSSNRDMNTTLVQANANTNMNTPHSWTWTRIQREHISGSSYMMFMFMFTGVWGNLVYEFRKMKRYYTNTQKVLNQKTTKSATGCHLGALWRQKRTRKCQKA